jgi:hypothetical protein
MHKSDHIIPKEQIATIANIQSKQVIVPKALSVKYNIYQVLFGKRKQLEFN